MTDDARGISGLIGEGTSTTCVCWTRTARCVRMRVAHTAPALHEALQCVRARTGGPPHAIAVGMETPHGVLVDTLLEQGFPVFAVNPKQLDRFRDRFTAAGAKDDRRDAHVVADSLRTDRRAFRAVRPTIRPILQLREQCRIVEELQSRGRPPRQSPARSAVSGERRVAHPLSRGG